MTTGTVDKRPNVIYIVADDLGFADLGCYGGRDASFGRVSPIIDSLADGGMRFTQGYANSPVCSPTRFGLITGRYQYRLRGAAEEPLHSNTRDSKILGLPSDHPTLPSLLREIGYRTALIGKWHLGFPPHFGPLKSGYEEFFGPMSGGVDYFTHCTSAGMHDLWLGESDHHAEGYLTDLLSQRAVEYVERMGTSTGPRQPFLLSLHYTAPHWPWETREDNHVSADVKGHLFHLHGGNVATYQRMIRHMDEGIGWVIDALKRTGQLDNTLIVFTSDNGGERFSDNWPLVGGKMDLTEGGIRVPWVIHWPAMVSAGRVSPQVCMSMDWTATMLDVAGAKPHPDYPLDGVSLLPVMRQSGCEFERPLFWRMNHRGQRAYRHGAWKYLKVDGHEYLFDLSQDERERANLGGRHPQRLTDMRIAWEQWNDSMPAIPSDAKVSLGYSVQDMPQR
jgi:arylsulfatase A-like enzyme